MAKTFTLTTAGRNAACNGFVDALDTGGTGTQSDLVIATSGSAVDIVSIGLGSTAFGAAATGVAAMTASSPTGTAGTSATSYTAAKFRLQDRGNNKLADGNVGTGTAFTMVISTATIASGDTVKVTSMTVTMPAS